MDQTAQPQAPTNSHLGKETPSSPGTGATNYRARAFYHWKKPGEKERHGFAMGVVSADEKTAESVIKALKKAYAHLEAFDVAIDRLEWR